MTGKNTDRERGEKKKVIYTFNEGLEESGLEIERK